jgi:flavin-dependent dehydrogenase
MQEITGFQTSVVGGRSIETRYSRVVSYAIRRCEFDNFLLRRAKVRVLEGAPLATLRRHGDQWVANDQIQAPVIIGAGGHFCPVARHLMGDPGGERAQPVIAREVEFALNGARSSVSADTPELFFCRDLEGYAWCVRKGEHLNLGIGRRERDNFADHFRDFVSFLEASGRAPDLSHLVWRGHAYHATGAGVRPLVSDSALLAGDAAGLAYPESGEGIRPAIESGRLAAAALIAAGGRYGRDRLEPYADSLRALHHPAKRTPPALRPLARACGRALLHSAAFTRHVMLDRWFLRNREEEVRRKK